MLTVLPISRSVFQEVEIREMERRAHREFSISDFLAYKLRLTTSTSPRRDNGLKYFSRENNAWKSPLGASKDLVFEHLKCQISDGCC